MRLLIVTQAVDTEDPVLGFFHKWIEEFAKHCEFAHVICLREGNHSLPPNVHVHSLGKESGRSRIKYITRFYKYIWSLRDDYDAVFVHMNPEYIVLGGLLWRMLGKKISLWYIHPKTPPTLRIGAVLTHLIFTAVAGSVSVRSSKIRVVGHGIDIERFNIRTDDPAPGSILFLGRLDSVKNVDLFVHALQSLDESGETFQAAIYGSPTQPDSKYAHDVRNLASPLALRGKVSMYDGVVHTEAARLFASHEIYVNLTPSGSFDKTVCEAMVAGCVPVVCNEAFRGILPDTLICVPRVEDVARAIRAALHLTAAERAGICAAGRTYIQSTHALPVLAQKIVATL